MSLRTKLWGFVAPLLLAVMVCTIAAAVNKFASPPGGLQLAHAARSDYGTPAVRTGSLKYPREAFDSDGVRVEIARPPQRIVSQSRPIEEYLYSVAQPQSIVGVSASAYEPNTSDVYPYVEKFHPAVASEIERTLRLSPDLIIVASSGRADISSLLRGAGVPLFRMYTMFTTLDEVADGIRLTGYLTGQDEAARVQEQRFRAELDKAFAMRPATAQKPRILALSMGIAYGRNTLFNDIVGKLGGINVGAEGGLDAYEEVNSETVLKWNPEWIVTGADPGKADDVRAQMLADPAIALTKAARDGHILVFDNRVFLPVSPYSAKLVTEMAQAIYGNSHASGGGQ
jgi:iron complex transport system substrate-binding protein